ncbi:hypothetical protein BVG19_g3546 [[Candida] boidinii]|nr:hypothetical protein BVG19_g3546 [[Candida] boidinii]OWB48941.1 hypothetical protein B5S27_g479 [[Candida] boidinii]
MATITSAELDNLIRRERAHAGRSIYSNVIQDDMVKEIYIGQFVNAKTVYEKAVEENSKDSSKSIRDYLSIQPSTSAEKCTVENKCQFSVSKGIPCSHMFLNEFLLRSEPELDYNIDYLKFIDTMCKENLFDKPENLELAFKNAEKKRNGFRALLDGGDESEEKLKALLETTETVEKFNDQVYNTLFLMITGQISEEEAEAFFQAIGSVGKKYEEKIGSN